MNSKTNSTPKTKVMPVRLCELNLSDIDDEDDEFNTEPERQNTNNKENEICNVNTSHSIFEQIKSKISVASYTTPLRNTDSNNLQHTQSRSKLSWLPSSSKSTYRELNKIALTQSIINEEEDVPRKENHELPTRIPFCRRKINNDLNKTENKICTNQNYGDSQNTFLKDSVGVKSFNDERSISKSFTESYEGSAKKDSFTIYTPISNETKVAKSISVNHKNKFTVGHKLKPVPLELGNFDTVDLKENIPNSTSPDKFISDVGLKHLEDANNKLSGIIEIKNYEYPVVCVNNQNIQYTTQEPQDHLKAISTQKPQELLSTSQPKDVSPTLALIDFKIPNSIPPAHSNNNCNTVATNSLKSSNNTTEHKIILGDKTYEIKKKLGSGGSSIVYLATEADTSEQRAVKVVNLTGDQALVEGYMNEVKLLSRLQGSDLVIKMFNFVQVPNEKLLYMIMECGESDFSHIIKTAKANKEIPFPIVVLVNYWIQMLEAVKFIHDHGVIHSDLKPANFLQVGGRLKLIDFGIASSISSDCTSIIKHIQTGTFNYMSPETLQDTSSPNSTGFGEFPNIKISFKSDVWSLGCILYLLLYGNTPFGHITRYCMKMAAIIDPNVKINFPELEYYPPILIKTAKRCLVHNPSQRPTVEELLQLRRKPFRSQVN